jgi:membrane protein YqaA with SNARE-associated domain
MGSISFFSATFFPISPDPLLVAMCFSEPKKWIRYASLCTVTSVLGGASGYLIGYVFWEGVGQPIVAFYQGEEAFAQVEAWYGLYGSWAVFLAALTPVPYKLFTIASGVLHFSLPLLIAASVVGRGIRFFLTAGVIRFLGPAIRPHLEKYLEVTTVVLFLLGVAGVAALKFFI